MDEVNRLKNQLKRHFVDGDDDNVRFYYIPDNFVNRMDHVKEIQVIIKKLEIKINHFANIEVNLLRIYTVKMLLECQINVK